MKWRDLLYFSKGERQALTLLLSLIAMAWIAIILTDFSRTKVLPDDLVTDNMKQDTSLPITPNGNPRIPPGKKTNSTRKKTKFPRTKSQTHPKGIKPPFTLISKGRKMAVRNSCRIKFGRYHRPKESSGNW